jgi:tetratricopeptide (TPR) repeat protein
MSENYSIKGFDEALIEASNKTGEGKYEEALAILEQMVKVVEEAAMFQDTEEEEYHNFKNGLEQVLYNESCNPGKKLLQIQDNYAAMYHKYGALLFEFKRYNEAEDALKKAHRYNPVCTDILFELSEVYKSRSDWETYLPMMAKCLEYAYSIKALARCYRNLGYYAIEEEQFLVATAFYIYSLQFDPESETARHELGFIAQKTGKESVYPENEEQVEKIYNLLKESKIQLGPNKLVWSIALSMGQEAQKADMKDVARYFFGIAYELTGSEEVKKILDEI